MADGPAAKKARVPQAQDFIKGWPHPDLLSYPQLKEDLKASFEAFLTETGRGLNYGDKENGAYMLGTPDFRQALATFLGEQYGKPCDWKTIMSTGGSSMGTDICVRMHSKHGDTAVCEAPTYYLGHDMMRNAGLNLLEVPIHEDGMDMDALEEVATAVVVMEEEVKASPRLHELACQAYVSFVRSYASYPREARDVFCFRDLHLGHCAKSFALRDPPSKITGIGKGQWVDKQERPTRTSRSFARCGACGWCACFPA